VMMRVAFETNSPGDLMSFHNPKLENGETLDSVALKLSTDVVNGLKYLLVGPQAGLTPEAYTVFCFTGLDGANDMNRWLGEHRREVAGLLTETASEKTERGAGERSFAHSAFV